MHKIVAETFLSNPKNKPKVQHKDGVYDNNHISNLRWINEDEKVCVRKVNSDDTGGCRKIAELDVHGNIIKTWKSMTAVQKV